MVLEEEPDPDFKLEAYRTALQARNFEIELFWQRSNYFLVLNTAIAVGFFSHADEARYAIPLSLTGAVVARLWLRVNYGSKFWQSRWEERLHVVEQELRPDLDLFSADWETIEADVRRSLECTKPSKRRLARLLTRRYNKRVLKKPSVSKSMTGLSALFVALWMGAFVVECVSALI